MGKWSCIGVSIEFDDVKQFAENTRSFLNKPLFVYLDIPVGSNMDRIQGWQLIVEGFEKKLSKWKANMFSIGCRSMLLWYVLVLIENNYCIYLRCRSKSKIPWRLLELNSSRK